jgi:transmembrane sensor
MPPKIPPLPPEPSEEIELAAADWLVLKDRGLTTAQQQDFARWLLLDPRHAEVFRALESTWSLMGEDQQISARMQPPPHGETQVIPFPRRRRRLPVVLAAAAALVIGLVTWQNLGPASNAPFESVATTDVGALRRLDLPDGTVVQLNTDSRLEIAYTAGQRRVSLIRGEAHFTVAKNPQRPFIVSASGVDVRAVGTAFNVRLRAESVDVLVTEGRVNVASLHSQVTSAAPQSSVAETQLSAGQRTSVPLAAAPTLAPILTIPELEIRHALAWQERRLEFESATLLEMASEINRYNRHKLTIGDPRLESHRFGGSFPAGDYATFVRLLENNFGVVAERRERETILRLPN